MVWLLIYGVLKGVKVEGDTHTHTHYGRIFVLDKLRELGMFWLGLHRPEFPGVGTWFVQVSSSFRSNKNIHLDRCRHSFQRAT